MVHAAFVFVKPRRRNGPTTRFSLSGSACRYLPHSSAMAINTLCCSVQADENLDCLRGYHKIRHRSVQVHPCARRLTLDARRSWSCSSTKEQFVTQIEDSELPRKPMKRSSKHCGAAESITDKLFDNSFTLLYLMHRDLSTPALTLCFFLSASIWILGNCGMCTFGFVIVYVCDCIRSRLVLTDSAPLAHHTESARSIL
jgi:hypothetical protein